MKLAYLAGPYRGKGVNGTFNNIMRAREVSRKYWVKGYAVICPHLNAMLMDGDEIGQDAFLKGTMLMMEVCEVVIMMRGWSASQGSQAEHERAIQLNKTIIYDEE